MSKIYLAERTAINWLYSAEVPVSGWTQIDPQNVSKGFTQTVVCTVADRGAEITENTQLSMPMALPTGDWEQDDLIRETLGVISDGVVEAGNGQVTIKVRQKTERDITIYWYGR